MSSLSCGAHEFLPGLKMGVLITLPLTVAGGGPEKLRPPPKCGNTGLGRRGLGDSTLPFFLLRGHMGDAGAVCRPSMCSVLIRSLRGSRSDGVADRPPCPFSDTVRSLSVEAVDAVDCESDKAIISSAADRLCGWGAR